MNENIYQASIICQVLGIQIQNEAVSALEELISEYGEITHMWEL